ncbi:hypothetical protein DAETH_04920 [Deinococcus aetherius]|uniref:Alpha/beta hydrolase n=1 Tax=Deinococcus aetherius TaxID=200252 RepID=A0ABN6REQ2_9DEIO|nr:hypothetical protein [Deinococcus aetherius]BDP40523.1 hypothetical protein DAETH_04920 [Deinococcus aetherius]
MPKALLVSALTLCALSACGTVPTPQAAGPAVSAQAALTPRPQGSPDVAIFVVSGRCGATCDDAPNDNWNYLEPQGTVAALGKMFAGLGRSVKTYAYSAHLRTHFSNLSGKQEAGFLDMEAQLRSVLANWVQGRKNPTRLVLVGHSHGTNWTHNLARVYQGVTFDYLIDLDGICLAWEDDHRPFIQAYYAERGGNPWPEDISKSCAQVDAGGLTRYDHKDVALRNVRYNLEIQSQRAVDQPASTDGSTNLLFDTVNNVRPDGSRAGISTFLSYDEGHNEIQLPGSEAMSWLGGKVQELGLP